MANVISIRIDADGKAAIVGIDKVTDAASRMDDKIDKSSKTMDSSWTNMAKGVVVGNLLSKSLEVVAEKAQQAAAYIKESAYYAAKVDMLGVAMHAVGQNAGYSAAQMDVFEAAVKKQGITTEAARQSLAMVASAQMDVTRASQLARVAQDAAVIGNINSSDAFARMVQGIRSGETEVLKTIGINVSFENAYKKTAQTLGIATTALTEHQKVLARQQAVEEYGVNIQGVYEAALGSTGKQITSMSRYYDELKLAMGEAFSPALGILIGTTTDRLKELLNWFSENREAISEFAKNMANIVDAASRPFNSIGNVFSEMFSRNYYDENENMAIAAEKRAWDQERAKIKIFAESERIAKMDLAREARENEDKTRLAKEKAEKAAKNARDIEMILEASAEKMLLVGKNADDRALIQMDLAHKRERKSLIDHHASMAQLAQLDANQQLEKEELLKNQKLKKLEEYIEKSKTLMGSQQSLTDFETKAFGTKFGGLSTDRYKVTNPSQYRLLDNTPRSISQAPPPERDTEAFNSLNNTMALSAMNARGQGDAADQTRLLMQLDERQQTIEKYYGKELELQAQKNAALLAADEEYSAQKEALDKATADKALQSVSNSLTAIGQTLMQGNKEQFEAGKAMAIAGATIDTFRAATGAYAAMASIPYVGPALGAVAAAAAVVSGMAQIAQIESTQYRGARALGGPVESGSTYLVGERGPELLTMGSQGGSVTPNSALRGQSQPVRVTNVFQISTGVHDTVRAEIMKAVPAITQHTVSAVGRAINSGGPLSAAVGRM